MRSTTARMFQNKVVGSPKWGELQQGTIFSGGIAERYRSVPVYGLVITARCDLSHDKVPLINYLPVVPIGEWMVREFADDVLEYLWDEMWSKLKSYLSNVGLSQSLLVSVSPQQIRNTIIEPRAQTDRTFRKLLPKWDEALAHIRHLEPLLSQEVRSVSEFHSAIRINLKHASNEFKRCLQQKMSGYYFLPAIRPEDEGPGWVVLLRGVQDLPLALAKEVAAGLTATDYDHLCESKERFRGRLDVKSSPDAFAAPVGQVRSPFLEHLMQTFSAMFARIGTDDIPADHIDTVVNALMKEES